MTWIVIEHPDLPGQTAVITADSFPAYAARGWLRQDDTEPAEQPPLVDYQDGDDDEEA